MKEFIDKLIERLEEYKGKIKLNFGNRGDFDFMEVDAVKEIVNELAEKFGKDTNVTTNGWIPVSSGKMPKCGEFDVKKVWVTMHKKGVDFYYTRKIFWNNYLKIWEWKNGKKMAYDWEVIAWMYIDVPAPYTEGE